jgi:hypothetical protein
LPELLGQFRDVGSIDLFVRQLGELFQAAFAISREASIRETLSYEFRHSACGRVPHPYGFCKGGDFDHVGILQFEFTSQRSSCS